MNRVTIILEHLGPSTVTKGRAPHGPSKYFEHFVDLSWVYVWSVNLTKPWASWILALSFFPACLRNGARNFEMSQHVTTSQQNTFCAPFMPVSLRDSSCHQNFEPKDIPHNM